MPPTPDPFQRDVARVALTVASRYGFALAGGQALIAHSIGARPTEDVVSVLCLRVLHAALVYINTLMV